MNPPKISVPVGHPLSRSEPASTNQNGNQLSTIDRLNLRMIDDENSPLSTARDSQRDYSSTVNVQTTV